MKNIIPILTLISTLSIYSQTPCVNGMAGGYPCNQITLLSHLSVAQLHGTNANDIWGWTDSTTGKEYALIGLTDGVTFVDISSPTSPIVIGKLIETHDHARTDEIQHGESSWRDIKVYANHAYIVSDLNEEHGMQIFDLTQLREFDGSTFQTFEQTANYTGIGSAHNMVINEATGFGYIVGISSGSGPCAGGGLHILNLQNPASPEYVGCFDNDGYTHDAQCVVYNGSDSDYLGMEICFNSNEDTFTIVNVEDKTDMQMISKPSYTGAGYTHQGWLSEDHNYFFMNDEFDESNNGYNPRTIIWDVRDLDNPVHIGEFYNEAVSIDHNLYTLNNLIFESNYSSGLRVLSSEKVADTLLREVAFFDTEPSQDVIAYVGSWSNYPYFESGNIIVSDMANGLFVLKLAIEDPITSHPVSASGCETTAKAFSVTTDATNLTFQWQQSDGTNFVDIVESAEATGTNTATLTINLSQGSVRVRMKDENRSIFYSYPAEMILTNTLPDVNFSFSLFENTITLTNSSTNLESHTWDFGDGTTSNEENPTHTYEEYGEYTITLTAENACGQTKEEKVVSYVLGGFESRVIHVYPNPSSSTIFIQNVAQATFQIHDLSGELQQKGLISTESNAIDVSSMAMGVYILSLEIDGQEFFKKISIR